VPYDVGQEGSLNPNEVQARGDQDNHIQASQIQALFYLTSAELSMVLDRLFMGDPKAFCRRVLLYWTL